MTRTSRRICGSFVALLGFILSPFSWWNDLLLNVPLALGFAWAVSSIDARWFTPAFVVGYWATNILGLILLHRGAGMIFREKTHKYDRKSLAIDLGISVVYTGIIVLLIELGMLKPLFDIIPPSSRD